MSMSKQMIVAANLTDLHREPSFLSEMLMQVFNGAVLEILEVKDRWCFVRQSDGYQGWAHRPYLTTPPAPAATHIVSSASALGLPDPTRRGAAVPRGSSRRSSVHDGRSSFFPQRQRSQPHQPRRHQHGRMEHDPLLSLAQRRIRGGCAGFGEPAAHLR